MHADAFDRYHEGRSPLHRLDPQVLGQIPDKGFPAIRALYSGRNLSAFALAEIFVQAISMMNSPMHRLRRPAEVFGRRFPAPG